MTASEAPPLGCAGGIVGALAGAVGGLIGGALFGPLAWLLRAWGQVEPGPLLLGALAAIFIGAFAGLFAGSFTGLPAGLALGARLRLAETGAPDLRPMGAQLGRGAGLLAAMLYWWYVKAPELAAADGSRERLLPLLASFALHLAGAMLAGAVGGRRAGQVFTSELEARLRRGQD